jgi:methylated-DNA-[protein]-cysteine S-methyltransferase
MPPKPLSAEYFDGWYTDQAAMPTVAETMNRHAGFPPGTRAGVVPTEAIPELTEELRLRPGSTLLDLACGRGAYSLLVAKQAGTLLIGVDFSAHALTEAREQAARMGVNNASFRVGELTPTGLPDGSVEAVLCTDAIQCPDDPAVAYDEIRRVLKPGGPVELTCWEPFDRADERLSPRLRRVDLAAGTPKGLVRVAYDVEDHDRVLETLTRQISPRVLRAPKRLDAAARELDEYFARKRRAFDLPLDLSLSRGFRQLVQRHLPEIGYGQTRTYGQVAQLVGNPKAIRAVGTACATNPLPVVVPCHRVLKADGTPGGYVGGPAAKMTLLRLEAAA